eukprot:CRZ03449.1 hypothetical protein [Spongospora subterranea]
MSLDPNAPDIDLQRCCASCQQRVINTESGVKRSADTGRATERVIYSTKTLCVSCSLIERRGFDPVDAAVIERDGCVYLERRCPTHGVKSIVYCRDASFFSNAMGFASKQPRLDADIDDFVRAHKEHRPIIMQLQLYSEKRFMSIPSIDASLHKFNALYSGDFSYMINVQGGSLPSLSHVVQFNSLVHHILNVSRQCLLLVELPYDRLRDLATVDQSCFLKGRVFPVVHYHLVESEQHMAINDLTALMSAAKQIADLPVILKLTFDREHPDLKPIIFFAVSNRLMFKYIFLSPVRSSKRLLALESKLDKGPNTESSVDPVGLIDHICHHIGARRMDFFPISIIRVLEPLFSILGCPRYPLNISPYSAFVCPIIYHSDGSSAPLSRLINIPEMLCNFIPLIDKMNQSGSGDYDHKAIVQCLQLCTPNPPINNILSPIPDLISALSTNDVASRYRLQQFFNSLQFIIVYNDMDVGSVDLRRRAQCAVAVQSRYVHTPFAAACSGGCF